MKVASASVRNTLLALVVVASGIGLIAVAAQAQSEADPSADVYAEMEQMLGSVPGFFKAFPKAGIAGAWEEFKTIQLNPDTALSGKEKELIGLAVAAQIPCEYCVYAHTAAAKANGATEQEIQEAVAMAALTRHWSTVLNGSQIDFDTFQSEFDAILSHGADQAAEPKP